MATSATELKGTHYAHPEVLVDTNWVADHLNDPKVKIVEVDVDTGAYDTGHIKGAIGLDWRKDCLLYTSPSPRDLSTSRMPSSA